jgi:hypothetical protein
VITIVATAYHVAGVTSPFNSESTITIEATGGLYRDGTPMAITANWAIRLQGMTLNKKGDWEWEPMPSSRTDAYLKRSRWHSSRAAIDFLKETAR